MEIAESQELEKDIAQIKGIMRPSFYVLYWTNVSQAILEYHGLSHLLPP